MSNEKILKAVCGDSSKPWWVTPNLPLECYVLEDGTPVLSGNGMYKALVNPEKATLRKSGSFTNFWQNFYEKGLVDDELARFLENPIKFTRPGRGGTPANGYEGKILKKMCDLLIKNKDNKDIINSTMLAEQSYKLLSAFAEKGIRESIYEITGYNKYKEEIIIRKLLGETVSNKLNGVIGKFPLDFYREIYRVFGWDFKPVEQGIINKNSHVAKLTMDWIYNRMLPIPGLVDELKSVNPERNKSGKLKHYYYQYLTTDKGLQIFDTHMSSILTILKLSSNSQDTMMNINKIHPAIYRDSEYEQDLLFEDDRKHLQNAKKRINNIDLKNTDFEGIKNLQNK